MKSLLTILSFSIAVFTFAQDGKKVQFVGGARAVMSNMDFQTDEIDTVTPGKSAGGYALIDLGFRINPNEQTEILGMIRIKNDLGGFWGSNVAFDVRQLYVRGVAGKIVRYQLGNIDYKMTPYTFYNHNPDMLLSGVGTLQIKEDILNYESFYSRKNTWRQQGAAIDFGLAFPKIIKDVKFNSFITRLNPSNLSNIFERFYGGGNMVVSQSNYFTFGLNHASIFDLKATATSDNPYKNAVSTITFEAKLDKDKWIVGLAGETGTSTAGYAQDSTQLTDFFSNTKAYLKLKELNLKLSAGYLDNGADFRSAGAQSKRINYNQLNTFYSRYTNSQIDRQISMYDLYNDPTLYSSSISEGIMDYNPAINNALPYGTASFNRKGIYGEVQYQDTSEKITLEAKYYQLSEIRGQGTTKLRKYNFLQTTAQVDLMKIFNMKRHMDIEAGLSYQRTSRPSEIEFEGVSLKSASVSIGAQYELVSKLFLMANVYHFESSGNDLTPIRNTNDEIISFAPFSARNYENYYAAGLKFNFTDDMYLSAFYESNLNNGNGLTPYAMNQFMIVYNLKF
jgi:hypothetical protein